jgi:3-oxoacyl-[acyl-carrier-protein] synthase-3
VIGTENLTKITNWKDRTTCVLFGDAAGAVLVEAAENGSGMLSSYWKADGNLGDLLFLPAGGSRIPLSQDVLDQDLHYLQMKGNEVFKYAVKRMGEAAIEAMKKAKLIKKDIDWLIPHQANIRIIDAIGRRLSFPKEKVYSNIHKYGNVSVATIPICIHELREAGKMPEGSTMLLVAFGAGFTWGALAYRW